MFKHIYFCNIFNFLFCPEVPIRSFLVIISAIETSVCDYFQFEEPNQSVCYYFWPEWPIQSVRDYFSHRNICSWLFFYLKGLLNPFVIISAIKTSVRDYFWPEGPTQSVRDYFWSEGHAQFVLGYFSHRNIRSWLFLTWRAHPICLWLFLVRGSYSMIKKF